MNKNYPTTTSLFTLLFFIVSFYPVKAQCPATGDQVSYGDQQWIGYVYSGTSSPPAANFSSTYQGYITQADSFELFPGGNALTGPNLCGSYSDNFAIRFRMQKTFEAGYYTFYVGADDGYRLSFDGGATWVNDLSDWTDHGFNTKAATLYRDGTYNMVLEFYENGGEARITFNFYEPVCTSTAPTGIDGNTNVTCNQGTTLYATGGVNAIGTTYQWGTGSVIGENVIAGQTQETITVYPLTPTTYWVRRHVGAPCEEYTAGVTIDVTTDGAPPGDPAEFGEGVWNIYAYNGVQTLEPSVNNYSGYYTQSTLGFDTSNGTNSWPRNSSPSSSAAWQGCPVGIDNFSFVHKRKGFPCGRYSLVMNNWDDNTRVYVNGEQVWQNNGWSGGEANSPVGTYNLDENSTIEVRTLEGGGDANAKLKLTLVSGVAPTAISGSTTVCSGSSLLLTATGATLGTNDVYQWGTGNVGDNILPGSTGASITITPTENTQYWVRLHNTFCGSVYGGITHSVTTTVSGAGTLSSASNTVCPDAVVSDIVLSGNTGTVIKWQSADDIAFVSDVADISNTAATLTSAQIGSLSTTKYFRAIINGGACGNVATPALTVTVKGPVIYDGSWSAVPDETTTVQINANLTLTEDMDFCACQINGTAELTVPEETNLTVRGRITVAQNAKLTVKNTGTIIQKDNVTNWGDVTVHRNSSKIRRLDYTMWSSPVSGQPLRSFSPQTLSNRFYRYNTPTDQYMLADTTSTMATAMGYLIRTPNNHPVTPTVQAGKFTGVPNNGNISYALTYDSGRPNSYNAVGNPYPSPIDIASFIDENDEVIHGTLYVWRKANDSVTSTYGVITKFGYAANTAAGGTNEYAIDPNGKLNVGQGFLVNAKAAADLVFTNSMRLGNSTNQFFRQAPNSNVSRFKLNITGGNNFAQTVAGYTPQATSGYDNGLDGIFFPNGSLNIYTLSQNHRLAIQAKGEFNVDDVTSVGYKATSGSFTIKLDQPEGIFAQGQNVYLKDKTLNMIHNLSASTYTFTTAAGTFNERFEIVYVGNALGAVENTFETNAIVYSKNNKITVSATKALQSIMVYDITGRKLYEDSNISINTYTTKDISTQTNVLIVKAVLEDGTVISKKIIME